jgi:gluconate 2-dehydrogenase gamma chain
MADNVSRKDFVTLVGTVVAAETLPAGQPAEAAPPPHPAPVRALTSEPEAYTFLTAPESAFVEAAVERLIPTDSLGPGGREAGVAFYIDQQLSGQFGYAAKMYRQGPWVADASADFGYQLPLLDGAQLSFDSVPAKVFFEMLYGNAVEGFFADPLYGGNRNKVGWKLIGFPGAAAAYISFIDKHNVPYNVNPQSIADLQEAEQTAMSDMPVQSESMEGMDMAVHTALAKKALGVR